MFLRLFIDEGKEAQSVFRPSRFSITVIYSLIYDMTYTSGVLYIIFTPTIYYLIVYA